MKSKKAELDVDYIGDFDGLTNEEEKALSEFFKQKKRAGSSYTVPSRSTFVPNVKTKERSQKPRPST